MQLSPKVEQFKDLVLSRFKDFNWNQKMLHLQQISRKKWQKISWKSPKVIAGLSLTVILAGGLTFYLTTTTSAAEILVNGQQVGMVRSASTGQQLVAEVLQQKGKALGVPALTHDVLTFQSVRVSPTEYMKSSLSEKQLADSMTYYLDGYKLEADGSVVATLPTKDDADKLLKEYQDYYVKPSDENKVTSVNFEEKVNVAEAEVSLDQVQSLDDAYKTLMDGKITTTDYTVKPKDSWWLIARKNDMLTDEVVAGNPGATKDTKLKPGQVIKLVNTTPFLTVVSSGTYSGSETIPYDVVTKTDSSLGYGKSKVVTQGSNGSKFVTYSYVQKNGIDVTKKEVSEKVTKSPVNQVVAKAPGYVTVAYGVSRGSDSDSSIVSRALSLQGSPYVFGGTSRSGFDCSGFTKYVYASSGISLPRTSYAQFASGSAVSTNDLSPGDLVFFTTYTSGASHVGIYIGGGRFIHASNPSSGIEISSLSDSFYSTRYLGARRY